MEIREIVGEEIVLLAEFNHRLFNTLQIIGLMVSSCRRDLACLSSLATLSELEYRLAAFGRMHRLLSAPAPRAGFEDHCRTLCVALVQAFGREDITPWVVMEDVDLSQAQAYSVTLLVVELVTNVLKHSLTEQEGGIVWVDLHARGSQIELTVSDNRKAPLPVFAPSRIVDALARGLKGEAFVQQAGGWIAGARIPSELALARGASFVGRWSAAN
jgi:two-component sensor histidine kinase